MKCRPMFAGSTATLSLREMGGRMGKCNHIYKFCECDVQALEAENAKLKEECCEHCGTLSVENQQNALDFIEMNKELTRLRADLDVARALLEECLGLTCGHLGYAEFHKKNGDGHRFWCGACSEYITSAHEALLGSRVHNFLAKLEGK